ncbi:MAG: leucine-rich repeat domain-containing protein, partial [Angelakisella sp.]
MLDDVVLIRDVCTVVVNPVPEKHASQLSTNAENTALSQNLLVKMPLIKTVLAVKSSATSPKAPPASLISFTLNKLTYTVLTENTVSVQGEGQTITTGVVDIPKTVTYDNKSYTVTEIAARAFFDYALITSMTIPDTVEIIGAFAFYACGSLTYLRIPASATAIDEGILFGCAVLKGVDLDPNNPAYVMYEGILYSKDMTRLVGTAQQLHSKTDVVVPSTVIEIGSHAFCGCPRIASVLTPPAVKTIGSYAFASTCGATTITCLSAPSLANDLVQAGTPTVYLPDGIVDGQTYEQREAAWRKGNVQTFAKAPYIVASFDSRVGSTIA